MMFSGKMNMKIGLMSSLPRKAFSSFAIWKSWNRPQKLQVTSDRMTVITALR